MATEQIFHSDLAIPPGEYLEEVLKDLGMSKEELAQRMDRPAAKLSQIYKGIKAITPETALQLEKVLGVPAHIWTGLEAEYRLTLAKQEAQRQLEEEVEFSRSFPYADLVQCGQVKSTRNATERVRELMDYFGVVSLRTIVSLPLYQAAFRCGKSKTDERDENALTAWLRMGERKARELEIGAFSKDLLQKNIPEIRAMILQTPEAFQPALQEELTACGVALVICPQFKGTRAHGATFWPSRKKAVLMITIRRKYADIFWFSLFHEIGHLLLHGKDLIIENETDGTLEQEADGFAAEAMIPSEAWQDFISAAIFNESTIRLFAGEQMVSPGIIVGRLQHEKIIAYNQFNELREKYEWKE